MDAPKAYKPMNLAALIDALDNFISDNKASHDVDLRWLSAELGATLQLVRECRSSLSFGNKARVNEFRAAEVERELESKRRDIDNLESQLKLLRKSAA